MTKRIFRSICLVALLVFFSSIALIMGVMYDYFSKVQQNQLKMQTALAAQGVAHEGMYYFDRLDSGNCRITWISRSGDILYDSQSDTASMKNHLEREEIRMALENGYGESDRYSATLMERSFYSARLLDDGSILRLSVTHSTIFILLLGMSQPVFLVFAIAVALSIILATRLSGRIVRPLNELDLDNPMANDSYEELSPLLRRIGSQQNELNIQKDKLHRKQEELNAVISNMKEGILLLNSAGEILSINPAAMELLDIQPYAPISSGLCHSLALQNILERALQGEPSEETLELKERHYQVTASPVISDQSVFGAALLLFDVTEKEQAEQMRREFTANVSHELKTPLHAISGYAELLANNLVKKEDICPFAGRIYTEARRMTKLIEDIISLSHLDEGSLNMDFETVNLLETAKAAADSLTSEAKAAGVSISLSGESAVLSGIPQLLFGMIRNLCDNAVKYNRAGGSVFVSVRTVSDTVSLSVRDTGIGIPPEHQEHIFERFYRVDKSHSKELGGTGLGLSIVKHAARIHHAALQLKSIPDEGTEICVTFPSTARLK